MRQAVRAAQENREEVPVTSLSASDLSEDNVQATSLELVLLAIATKPFSCPSVELENGACSSPRLIDSCPPPELLHSCSVYGTERP